MWKWVCAGVYSTDENLLSLLLEGSKSPVTTTSFTLRYIRVRDDHKFAHNTEKIDGPCVRVLLLLLYGIDSIRNYINTGVYIESQMNEWMNESFRPARPSTIIVIKQWGYVDHTAQHTVHTAISARCFGANEYIICAKKVDKKVTIFVYEQNCVTEETS